MNALRQLVRPETDLYTGPSKMTAAIMHLIDLCQTSQKSHPDAAVAYELIELQALHKAVMQQWPLTPHTKQAITLGPVAAKNIEDWKLPLGNALMELDYALRNDGSPAPR